MAAAKKAPKKAAKKAAKKDTSPKSKAIPDLKGETWRKVEGTKYEYHVSNKGRVKSFTYDTENGKLMKGKHVNGYLACDMVMKKGRKLAYIHNLVAESFLKKASPKHNRVIHLDWKKMNNSADNLKYVTQKDSYARNAEYNAKKFGAAQSVNAKLTVEKVKQLRKDLKAGVTQASIARKLKVSLMTVSRIATGKSWVSVK